MCEPTFCIPLVPISTLLPCQQSWNKRKPQSFAPVVYFPCVCSYVSQNIPKYRGLLFTHCSFIPWSNYSSFDKSCGGHGVGYCSRVCGGGSHPVLVTLSPRNPVVRPFRVMTQPSLTPKPALPHAPTFTNLLLPHFIASHVQCCEGIQSVMPHSFESIRSTLLPVTGYIMQNPDV